jgi:hypothetical protein
MTEREPIRRGGYVMSIPLSWLQEAEINARISETVAVGEARAGFWSNCRAEQHVGDYAYRCIFYHGHDGPHGRLVPKPTWWTGDDGKTATK